MAMINEKALDMAMDAYFNRMIGGTEKERKQFKKDCRQDFIDSTTDYLTALEKLAGD